MNQPKRQFSLRATLITLGCVGAGIGLLGRLYRYQPEVCLSFIAMLIPLTYAVVIAWIAFSRRLKGTTATWVTVIVSFLMLLFLISGLSKRSIHYLPTRYLIEEKLFAFTDDGRLIDDANVWREINRRFVNERLTRDDVNLVFDTMEQKLRDRKEQPEVQFFSTQNALRMMASSGMVDDERLVRLGEAFYEKPRPKPIRVRMPAFPLELKLEYGSSNIDRKHPTKLIWQAKRITANDEDVAFAASVGYGAMAAGISNESLPVGKHEVTAELEFALVSYDEVATSGGYYPIEKWPKKPKKRWTEHVVFQVEVFPEDAEIIRLTTREELDPTSYMKFSIKRMPAKKGPKLLFGVSFPGHTPVAVSGNVTVTIDGHEFSGGRIAFEPKHEVASSGFAQPLNWSGSRSELMNATAKVVLSPDPRYLERDTTVTEIWGKPILVENVPIEPW